MQTRSLGTPPFKGNMQKHIYLYLIKQNLRSWIIKFNNLVYMCMFHLIDGPSAEGSDQPHFWHDSTQEKTHHLL